VAPNRVARSETEPRKYWMSNLPEKTRLRELVGLAKQRWIIERDYEELKQELGLGHFEAAAGAASIITPHSVSPPMASWWRSGVAFPSAHSGHLGLSAPELPPDFNPRFASVRKA